MAAPTPPTKLSVGIVIVSTTAAQDPSSDASGALLRNFFGSANETAGTAQWVVEDSKIVGDDVQQIQSAVLDYVDMKLNLVITTGGTGFAVSDCTPEAVKELLQKEAPGLVHAMLAASLIKTPFAMMSRPVAGVRGNSLIITIPGSPKGAVENLEALIKLLPHACIQVSGAVASRALHSGGVKELEKAHGVHSHPHSHSHDHSGHHHGHGHHAPKPHTTPEQRAKALDTAVTLRHRESPYPMLSVADATALIDAHTSVLPAVYAPVDTSLVGHVLAADVAAPEAVPAFPASIVDGYAVHHGDGAGTYPVVAVSHAAPGSALPLQRGQIARITTGAPLPPGATAVVMVEDTVIASTTADGTEEATVTLLAGIADGENVRAPGSDVALHATILRAGTLISATGAEIGLLASVGLATVPVYARPRVAVLSTGDELVPHTVPGPLRPGQIRDSNTPTLLAALASAGFPARSLGIAPDTPDALAATLRGALYTHDVVITSGGVSMGERDLLKGTIEHTLGGRIHFGRVAMKPGKPTTFATVGDAFGGAQLFALPGNPASALTTLHLFVLPALRKAAGIVPWELPRVRVVAGQDFRLDERPEFHRVVITAAEDGRMVAVSTGVQRSSGIKSASGANGVLCLPARKEVGGKRAELGCVPAGEMVEAIMWGVVVGLQ
ncbi:hypothetical protein EDC01DRAFT_790756 [Geopyxis carbonaria]|nr:hypothetical protein EDC01DRAFT_790756 [Geopyxis carbonaria]